MSWRRLLLLGRSRPAAPSPAPDAAPESHAPLAAMLAESDECTPFDRCEPPPARHQVDADAEPIVCWNARPGQR